MNSWNRLVERSAVLRFVDASLRGSGQVMLQDNPLTGLLFLVGIGWAAAGEGNPKLLVVALVALGVATATAMLLHLDPASIHSGLYGFNGILVGMGLATFLAVEGWFWAYLVLGAAVSVLVMSALAAVFSTWKVPPLTFPFVLVCWWMLLAASGSTRLPTHGLGPASLPESLPFLASRSVVDARFLLPAWLRGVGQVFLLGHAVSGAIFVIGLAVSSWRAALFALVGSAVGLGSAWVLGASVSQLGAGLFGFSAVLTAIALGATFYPRSLRTWGVALVGTVFTVVVQAALNLALSPVGLPTFTAPFVFVTWLFLLPHLKLAPVPHALLPSGQDR